MRSVVNGAGFRAYVSLATSYNNFALCLYVTRNKIHMLNAAPFTICTRLVRPIHWYCYYYRWCCHRNQHSAELLWGVHVANGLLWPRLVTWFSASDSVLLLAVCCVLGGICLLLGGIGLLQFGDSLLLLGVCGLLGGNGLLQFGNSLQMLCNGLL